MTAILGRTDNRRDRSFVPNVDEDAGLFRGEICKVKVELTAEIQANGRSDLLVTGFLNGGAEVKVVFAGRRSRLFDPLKARLRALYNKKELKLREEAGAKGEGSLDLRDVRLMSFIEGAWRVRFEPEAGGFQKRHYDLMAARWAVHDEKGEIKTYGFPPNL